MKITILTENTVSRRGLLAEHGLCVLVEEEGRRVLFDTGQSDVYLRNAGALQEDLTSLDAVALSHGHYDHAGGLPELQAGESWPPVYYRRGAFDDKYSADADSYRRIGIPYTKQELKERNGKAAESLREITDGLTEILPRVYLIGNIPYTVPIEPPGNLFYILGKDGYRADRMEDEQLLVFRTQEGLCVFAGCCHMGILNCLAQVERCFPSEHFHLILAGMHLRGCGKQRMNDTIEGLSGIGFDYLIPVHCTGMTAIAEMRLAFGKRCLSGETGKIFYV